MTFTSVPNGARKNRACPWPVKSIIWCDGSVTAVPLGREPRRTATGGRIGPVPLITFSSEPFMHDVGGRTVFRPNKNLQMVHLGHPLMGKALNLLGQKRDPGTKAAVSRWTARFAPVPDGAEALILLHLEELAVNELRETFHH